MSENQKWVDLGFSEKTKLSLSIFLIISSVILGFISFFLLNMIPTSVIGISGLWCSTALALLGITSYFSNELIKMRTKVNNKIDELDNVEKQYKERIEEQES